MSKHIIGTAKRDIKAGELIELRIREDGFCESSELRFRSGLSFLDLALLNNAVTPPADCGTSEVRR